MDRPSARTTSEQSSTRRVTPTSERGQDTYAVEFAGTARRDLREVPPRIVLAIIEFVYGDLARNPKRVGKPLKRELEGLWSARRGPYRILYELIDEQLIITIIHIDHRADIYRPG